MVVLRTAYEKVSDIVFQVIQLLVQLVHPIADFEFRCEKREIVLVQSTFLPGSPLSGVANS